MRIVSPVETRTVLDAGEGCAVFLSATVNAFEPGADDFWELARRVKQSVVTAKSRENIAAVCHSLRQVLGEGAGVEEAAQFMAHAFAREAMLSNLGALPFDTQFGRVKLDALWGPAVVGGLEGRNRQSAWRPLTARLCLTHTSHTPPGRTPGGDALRPGTRPARCSRSVAPASPAPQCPGRP